jgi:hypothetical protein
MRKLIMGVMRGRSTPVGGALAAHPVTALASRAHDPRVA